MTETDREAFEAWWRQYGIRLGGFEVPWEAYQAATQRQQSRIAELEALVKEKAPEAFATGAAGSTEHSIVREDGSILAQSERDIANFAFQASQDMLDKIAELEADAALGRQMREAIGNESLARFIEKHGEPVPIMKRVAELEAEVSKLTTALFECREALSIPAPGSPTEAAWMGAMTDPEDVPEFVKAEVQALRKDAERMDWMEKNLFSREPSDWDSKYGACKNGKNWAWGIFAPSGVQGSARRIIDAAMNKEGATD